MQRRNDVRHNGAGSWPLETAQREKTRAGVYRRNYRLNKASGAPSAGRRSQVAGLECSRIDISRKLQKPRIIRQRLGSPERAGFAAAPSLAVKAVSESRRLKPGRS